MKFHGLFGPTGPSSIQCLLHLPQEPILIRMQQVFDAFYHHFRLCPQFVEGCFEVVDFRCVSLGPYLVLQLDFLLALRFLRVIVLEVANFILQGLLCLFHQFTPIGQLVFKPLLLLLLRFLTHFQNLPFRLSFGVEVLVEGHDGPLVGCDLGL